MPRFVSKQLKYWGFYPKILHTLDIFELVEATAAEICAAFTMEAYPRVLVCPPSIINIISEKLVAEAFVKELIFCVH